MPQLFLNPFLVTPAGVQPPDFPNLVMWYRGDYQAWNGGGPVGDNNPIDFWGEKFIGTANAGQASGLEMPLFQSAELNGQDVIEFQGTLGNIRSMNVPNGNCPVFDGAGQEDLSMFVVMKPSNLANYQMILTKGVPNSTANIPEFRINPSGKMELVEDANFTFAATTALTNNVWQVIGGVRDETNSQLRHYLNGAPNGSGARGSSTATTNSFHIGRREDGLQVLDMYIAEILVYKHAFTNAEALSLQSYFTTRYGI